LGYKRPGLAEPARDKGRHALRLLSILFFAAAMLFSLGEMGYLTGPLNLLTAFTLAIVFLVINWPRDWGEIPRRRRGAGVILLILAAALAMTNEAWRPLAFVVLPAAVVMGVRVGDPRRRETALLIPTAVFYLALLLAIRHLPYIWWVANTASLAFSEFSGSLIGQQYTFGPTASGFWVMMFAASWGLSRFIWSEYRNRWKLGIYLLMLLVMGGLVQVLLTPIAIAVQHWAGWMDFILFNAQILYLLAASLPIAWYRRSSGLDTWGLTAVFQPGLLFLVFIAGLLLGIGCAFTPRQSAGMGRISILDEGLLNWRVPEFGYYGEHSGGMFGRLPGFLHAQGYDVAKVPRPINAKALSGSRTLMIINLMEYLDPAEKEAIWEFVDLGGTLLLLGDHTGVEGIRGPSNDLLDPVGIRLNFDSATYWSNGWRDAFVLDANPVNRGTIVAEDIQIWVGASLSIGPAARPVVMAKHGYSDMGDPANADMGYLGDRRHNPGERIGDLVLVAEAGYGRGRVLVFGDTSPFQNLALVSSWSYVQRVFQRLTGRRSSDHTPLRLILVLIAVILLDHSGRALGHSVFAWMVLAGALTLAVSAAGRFGAIPPPKTINLPKAIMDFSHGERFDEFTWYHDCIGGLELNLARNGYAPLLMRTFDESLVGDSELLVIIAPSKPFSRLEEKVIDDFMRDGGTLILSTGYEERDHSEPILDSLGVALKNIPLAHFETAAMGDTIRLAEAWPLNVSAPGAIEICYYPGVTDPVMVFIPRGRGGALVIGDSQFLLNENLEGLHDWHPGNIMFLRKFFERLKSGDLKS
jgi:hypothetical protein